MIMDSLIIPEDHCKVLLSTMRENCRIVEELALEAVSSQHIPLLNTTSCLTKEDCKFILDKYHLHCDNVYEHIVVLIALTDFISCVCTNSETFPLTTKRNQQKGIKLIMQTLKTAWRKQLINLPSNGMTENQLINVMKITKRCIERIPQNNYKVYLEAISKMQVKALNTLLKTSRTPQDNTPTSVEEVPRPVSKAKKVAKANKGELKESCNIIKFVRTHDDTVNNEYSTLSENVTTEAIHSQDNTSTSINKVPKHISKARKMKENKGMLKKTFNATKFVKTPENASINENPMPLEDATTEVFHSQDSTCASVNKVRKRVSKAKKMKGIKEICKESSKITKFVLKPSENVVWESQQLKETLPLTRKLNDVENVPASKLGKGKVEDDAIELMDELQNASPKKHCVHDDFINGKVNAFKMLMNPSKRKKFSTLEKCKQ